MKNFITSGGDQIFLTKTGDIIPFSNTNDLLNNKEVEDAVKKFVEIEKIKVKDLIESDKFKNIENIKHNSIIEPKTIINTLQELELKGEEIEQFNEYKKNIKEYLKKKPHDKHPKNQKIFEFTDMHHGYKTD